MLTVSNYHYIREDFTTPYPSIFGVTPLAFKDQLLACKEVGEFIHPNDLLQNLSEVLSSEKNYVLVTFDDGLQEQFSLAKPILDQLDIPAMFFVNSLNFIEQEVSLVHKIHLLRSQIAPVELMNSFSEIDKNVLAVLSSEEKEKARRHYNFDKSESANLKYLLNFKLSVEQQSKMINSLFAQHFNEVEVNSSLYMTESQLKQLASEGMLGSHAHSHLALGYLSNDLIEEELAIPKRFLETLTKSEISYLSYPYGSQQACAKPVPETAKKLGYKIGFTMERGINSSADNQLLLKRFDCNDLPMGKNEKVFKNAYSLIYE